MKYILLFLLTFQAFFSFGQFAMIADKDGHCNVRKEGKAGNNVVDTLGNGHLTYCMETEDKWINIDYSKKKRGCNGYVYRDRIKMISDYDSIPTKTDQVNAFTLGKDSVEILITSQKFDKTKYRFSYGKDNQSDIQMINGKPYWGTDGEQPKTEYKSISIIMGKRKIILPRSALENLFEPTLFHSYANYDRENDILYVGSSNSDGAGGYEVIWKIEKGVYTERYVAYGF
jgi:hypothetical protein